MCIFLLEQEDLDCIFNIVDNVVRERESNTWAVLE